MGQSRSARDRDVLSVLIDRRILKQNIGVIAWLGDSGKGLTLTGQLVEEYAAGIETTSHCLPSTSPPDRSVKTLSSRVVRYEKIFFNSVAVFT